MAISPADFYAYSRATGVPIPEDPAERMEMAPEVMEFRRNQLRAPSQERQQGPDLLSLGIGAGLALAGGAGAFLGARRLMRGPKQSATSGVQTANLAEMAAEASPVRRVVQESQPAPSRVAPQVGEQEFVAYRPDPKEMVSRQVAEARRQSATESLLKAAESRRGTYQPDLPGTQATLMALRSPLVDEAAGVVEAAAPSRPLSIAPQQESLFSPRSYIEQSGAVAPAEDLTSLQQRNFAQVADQNINAVESGEDQMTGRVRQQLQRNEDLNLSDIDALEEQTQNINIAAAQTEDGAPVDQAKGMTSAARFMQRERDEIASQLGEQGIPLSPSRIEKELANRLSGSEAWTYGSKYTQRKQALQLGATYEPAFFENLKTPSVRIAGETIPTEQLKEPVAMQATAQRLQEKIENKRDWLGQVRLEEQKNKVRLMNVNKNIEQLQAYQNEVTDFLSSGKASPEQIRLGQQRLSDLSLDLNRLDTQQSELTNRVFYGDKRIAGARSSVEQSISELELPKKLKSGIEEGQRLFFEVDPLTNKPLPGTQELRSEKYAIDTDPKTGGGRNYAMYDPESQTGSSVGIYGIEPRDYPIADPELRPTALQREETKVPLRRMPTEGPALKTYIEETKRARAATPETKQRSLEVSEAMRRARIEGRDPNMVLRNLGFNL
jgi:hypothetical protein